MWYRCYSCGVADTEVTRVLTTVDLADRSHPEKSGRYVSLAQLLALVGEMRETGTPLSELERVLRKASR